MEAIAIKIIIYFGGVIFAFLMGKTTFRYGNRDYDWTMVWVNIALSIIGTWIWFIAMLVVYIVISIPVSKDETKPPKWM